jgi:hypothetical protein
MTRSAIGVCALRRLAITVALTSVTVATAASSEPRDEINWIGWPVVGDEPAIPMPGIVHETRIIGKYQLGLRKNGVVVWRLDPEWEAEYLKNLRHYEIDPQRREDHADEERD